VCVCACVHVRTASSACVLLVCVKLHATLGFMSYTKEKGVHYFSLFLCNAFTGAAGWLLVCAHMCLHLT